MYVARDHPSNTIENVLKYFTGCGNTDYLINHAGVCFVWCSVVYARNSLIFFPCIFFATRIVSHLFGSGVLTLALKKIFYLLQ